MRVTSDVTLPTIAGLAVKSIDHSVAIFDPTRTHKHQIAIITLADFAELADLCRRGRFNLVLTQ